jgi:two-component system, NtrC family, sensor kinase
MRPSTLLSEISPYQVVQPLTFSYFQEPAMADNSTMSLEKSNPSGFQSKFLLVLATILLLFSGFAALIIYQHEKQNLEENAFEKTDLIMKSIKSTRDYIQDILRPAMYREFGEDRFIIEAMSSSYISRMIMERFNEKTQGFVYRRVAANAKNPEYEANPLEIQMIKRFQADPQLEEWHGIIELESEKYFMRFQPVRFRQSCLSCHGDPTQAPAEVISRYGMTRGFFYKPDEIAGVSSVGMPIDLNLAKIKNFAIALFLGVVPFILIVYVIISAFFNRYIAGSLRNILSYFRETISDDKGKTIFEDSQKIDEIDELTATAKAIAEHMHQNQNTLRQYADEVSKSKDLLQSVFDGITDPVVLLDKVGRIKIVNAAFLGRYNLSMDFVLDQKPIDFLQKDCCPLVACEDIFSALPDHPVSREVFMATGEIFLIYFYPIRLHAKETDSLVCYVKDITEQKKLESKIQHTEKVASIGQLAAGIAHEINNPLGVILCHIDLIEDAENLSPEIRADLQIIKKHAGNCQTIISDLLKFAHQHDSVKEPISINALIEEVVLMVGSQFRKQLIDIEIHLAENLPEITVDTHKIKQVIINLLLNSSQAIGEKGTITIRSIYEPDSRKVKIIVEDSGPGIPADILVKIFDPFFTTKPPGQGTGLGLSVSYGIIQDHDGEITAESLPGQPTQFVISLPA